VNKILTTVTGEYTATPVDAYSHFPSFLAYVKFQSSQNKPPYSAPGTLFSDSYIGQNIKIR